MAHSDFLPLIKSDWIWERSVPVMGTGRDSGGENQIDSVSDQRAVYEAFVAHHHLTSLGFFGDENRKSSRTENREQLQRMLEEINRRFPKIDDLYARERYLNHPRCVLVVWKFNRLSRDPAYATFIRADLALRGIFVLELSEEPPTGNDLADNVVFLVKRQGDRELLRNISTDTKRGQVKNLTVRDTDPEFRRYNPDWPTADGRYIGIADGPAPVGYRGVNVQIGVKNRDRQHTHQGVEVLPRVVQCLVVDEAQWTLCYQAWLMRHEGSSIAEIHQATHLYKNHKGYAHFFQNRIYTGDYEHGGQLYEQFVPALIPREWFEQEQARREERAKKRRGETMSPQLEPRRVASPYLLSGKLFCGAVEGEEHSMHGHTCTANAHRSEWAAYECATHKQTHGEACPFYGVSRKATDEALLDVIFRQVITRETLRPLAEALNEHLLSWQTTSSTQLAQLKEQIAHKERQRQKYARLITDDDDPSPTLVTELKKVEREKHVLLEQKRQLEGQGSALPKGEPITDAKIDDYIARVRQVLLGGDAHLAQRILDHFVDKIVVKERTGTLYYTFPFNELSPLRTRTPEGAGVR